MILDGLPPILAVSPIQSVANLGFGIKFVIESITSKYWDYG